MCGPIHNHIIICLYVLAQRWLNVGFLLGQRRRRWPNSKPPLCRRLMFAGISLTNMYPLHDQTNDFPLKKVTGVFHGSIYSRAFAKPLL